MKKGFFNYDGPVFEFITKLLDLIKLNFLVLLFSLPIFTVGTALTAAHYVAIKIRRGESYVAKNFWKSFKENFKQSTIIWLFVLIFLLLTFMAQYTFSNSDNNLMMIMKGMIFTISVMAVFVILWVFPVQARFVNSIPMTFINAARLSVKNFWRTIYMIMMHLLPILLLVASMRWAWIVMLYGLSAPIYLSSGMYDKIFKRIEESMEK